MISKTAVEPERCRPMTSHPQPAGSDVPMAVLYLADLFHESDLAAAIEQGYVRVQTHPTLPLQIFNYTEKTQYEQAWGPVTMGCRGLIVDLAGRVLARPFAKFFNHGDAHAGELDLSAPVEVLDKLDGSLGILYPTPDGYAVATRGSFASEQALHATELFRDRYADFEPPDDMTVLFEIVYPENRIVCDYGGADDLFLLGAVDIATGHVVGPDWVSGWWGPQATAFSARTLADALAMEPRPGAEGLVVRFVDSGHMIKIKQEDYVRLHAVITRTSSRTVWEFCAVEACRDLITAPKHWGSRLSIAPERAASILAMGTDWEQRLVDGVPDEFHAWLRGRIDGFRADAERLHRDLTKTAEQLRATAEDDRAAYAAAAKTEEHSGALFLLRDGRDITTYVWKALYPEADRPWGERSEAIA